MAVRYFAVDEHVGTGDTRKRDAHSGQADSGAVARQTVFEGVSRGIVREACPMAFMTEERSAEKDKLLGR